MKLLILDFIRRWKWGYLLAIVFASGFLCMSATVMAQTRPIYPIALYFGAFLLGFDFFKGSARVLSGLPLNRREIGRAWFHLGVTLPAILAATLRMVIQLCASGAGMDWSFWLIASLWDLAYCGSSYFLLTFQPSALRGAASGTHLASGGLWGIGWGLSFGSVALVAPMLPGAWSAFNPITAIALLAGLQMTLLAFLRADSSARARLAFRPVVALAEVSAKPSTSFFEGNLAGIPQMLWGELRIMIRLGIVFFALLQGFDLLIHHLPWNEFVARWRERGVLGQNFAYWFSVTLLVFGAGARASLNSRHWRSLPLPAWKLSLISLLPTWLGTFITWLIPAVASILIAQRLPEPAYFLWLLSFIAINTLGQALVLRWKSRNTLMLLILLVQVLVPAARFGIEHAVSGNFLNFPLVATVSIILFLASIRLAHRFLTRASATYKPIDMPFLQAWSAGH